MNPKAFLLENVKGLEGHDQGNTMNRILDIILELGYFSKGSKLEGLWIATK